MSFLFSVVFLFIFFMCVVLCVAFFTLLERKFLSYAAGRKGPNKVFFLGVLQPVSDALKLVLKHSPGFPQTPLIFFILGPAFMFFFSLLAWAFFFFYSGVILSHKSVFYFIILSTMMIYAVLFSGWGSNSTYSMVGSLRALAQMVSYEIGFIFILLAPLVCRSSLEMGKFFELSPSLGVGVMVSVLLGMWLICMVAETNRAPFDFVEGESELVSGYNVEFSGVSFALLFLGEYASIIFLSFLSSLFWVMPMMKAASLVFFCSFMLILRAAYPRLRYDLLMIFCWMFILPISLFYSMVMFLLL